MKKMTSEEKLQTCKMYFKIGLFLLPLVWLVNFIWFYKEVFKKPPTENRRQMKKYVILSIVGCVIYTMMLLTWLGVYNYKRYDWDRIGDKITFIFPVGEF